MSVFSKLSLIFVLVIGFSGIAIADPVRITSGSAVFQLGSNFNLTGNDLSRYVGTTIGGNIFPSTTTYQPNTAFSLVTELFSQTGASAGSRNDFRGVFTNSNGTITPVVYIGSTGFSDFSSLAFTSQISGIPSSAGSVFSIQVPFSMQGILRPIGDCTASLSICNQLFATQNVSGNGLATYNFERDSSGNYFVTSRRFDFENTEPTPEPTTILLLGTGLAGIVGYARRRKNLLSN